MEWYLIGSFNAFYFFKRKKEKKESVFEVGEDWLSSFF